jgi:hypothetical protein
VAMISPSLYVDTLNRLIDLYLDALALKERGLLGGIAKPFKNWWPHQLCHSGTLGCSLRLVEMALVLAIEQRHRQTR